MSKTVLSYTKQQSINSNLKKINEVKYGSKIKLNMNLIKFNQELEMEREMKKEVDKNWHERREIIAKKGQRKGEEEG